MNNIFYFFISTNYTSESVSALFKVLKKQDNIISRLIDLSSCNKEDRNIANYLDVQSTPCLIIANKSNEKLEQINGPYQIFSKIDFLFSKYGL